MDDIRVTDIIEVVKSNICDNFCKWTETADDECNCQWIREGNDCPLDVL